MSQPAVPAKEESAASAGSRLRSLWLPAFICLLLLIGELYILFHDLQGSGASRHAHSAPIATYESGKNEVRQKTGGTILWQAPEAGQSLFQQDAIATMSGSEATVRFADQSELVIEPDSLIVFEEANFPKVGGPAKIVARLVRGSVKRRNAGPSDLLIKLPGEAAPVELADPQGGAVFRVVYRSNGIEVVVESGGVRMNGKELKPAPPAKLPSPNLKKPEIEIRKIPQQSSFLEKIRDAILPEARADEQHWLISIHFAWEPVPGADAYRIQIATDPEFHSVILDKAAKDTAFDYQSDLPAQPQTLYMHVAGQDANGNIGDFSAPEKIHIQSVSEISRETVATAAPAPLPMETPKPRKKNRVAHRPSIAPPKSVATANVAAVTHVSHLDVSYGALYQSRTFKGSDLPTSTTASGVVPAELHVEFSRMSSDGGGWKAGGSYLFEIAQSGSSGAMLQNSKISVPVFRGWYLMMKEMGSWTGGLGPYLANTSTFSWSGASLSSQSKLLEGALLDFSTQNENLFWRASIGVLGLGATGVDATLSARKSLFQEKGIFGNVKAQARFISLESAYGGGVEVGKTF